LANTHSSFDNLPVQLEWSLVGLLGYAAYVFPHTSSAASYMTALCGGIILNGWISSRAGTSLYNDILIFIDVAILFLYYLMLNSLLNSSNSVSALFWIYSALLAASYSLWDIFILNRATAERKKRYILYIVLLVIITGGHFFLSWLSANRQMNESYIVLLGGGSWIAVLALWHFDKWRITHSAS
jgi:hypothetical protein